MRGNPAPRLRARNSDRAGVRELLDTAYTEGQLSADEHRQRAEAAERARTLADLDRLVRDLQVRGSMRDRLPVPAAEHTRRWIAGLAVAAIVVAGGVVASRITDSATAADARPDSPLSAAGLARIVADLHAEYGDATVDDMTVHADYAVIERAEPGAPGLSRNLRYEDGLDDNGTSPGRTPGTVPVDLDALDVRAVSGLLLGAPQSLRVITPDSTFVTIKAEDHGPAVTIHLSDQRAGRSGYMTVGLDGEIVSVYPAAD